MYIHQLINKTQAELAAAEGRVAAAQREKETAEAALRREEGARVRE